MALGIHLGKHNSIHLGKHLGLHKGGQIGGSLAAHLRHRVKTMHGGASAAQMIQDGGPVKGYGVGSKTQHAQKKKALHFKHRF